MRQPQVVRGFLHGGRRSGAYPHPVRGRFHPFVRRSQQGHPALRQGRGLLRPGPEVARRRPLPDRFHQGDQEGQDRRVRDPLVRRGGVRGLQASLRSRRRCRFRSPPRHRQDHLPGVVQGTVRQLGVDRRLPRPPGFLLCLHHEGQAFGLSGVRVSVSRRPKIKQPEILPALAKNIRIFLPPSKRFRQVFLVLERNLGLSWMAVSRSPLLKNFQNSCFIFAFHVFIFYSQSSSSIRGIFNSTFVV